MKKRTMKKRTMKKLQLKTIQKAVVETCEKEKIDLEEWQIHNISQTLKDINDICSKGNVHSRDDFVSVNSRQLFAICEKKPRNLDSGSGRHYYSVQYIKDNEIQKAWFWEFIKVFGGHVQNRDINLDKYVFASGAIGMSRLIAATDGLFQYLRRIGGFYTQIRCR